jgi:hypothetical protein
MIQGLSESMIYDPETTVVRSYAFYKNKSVTSIDLPKCTSIGRDAFFDCGISSISLPECKYVGYEAFMYNHQLTTIFLPKCLEIDYAAFRECKGLQAIDLPVCSSVKENAFKRCYNLSQVNIPECGYVDYDAFDMCINLSQIDLPKCTTLRNSAFMYCSKLESISLPMCQSIEGLVFQECITLSEIDLPMCTYISGATFNSCSNLTTVKLPILASTSQWWGNGVFLRCPNLSQLYIGSTYGVVVPYLNMFNNANTKLQSGIGSIYVNVDNYDSYINATGWSSLSSLFVSVGDTLLSFSNGVVSGTTTVLYAHNQEGLNYKTYLGISSADITEVNLPECKYIGRNAFRDCTSLSQVSLPECVTFSYYALQNCSLSQITLPNCKFLGNAALEGNPLTKITLNYSSVCTLDAMVFFRTPIASGTGSIYVPTSLVDAYKSANNWSVYASQIFAIE